MSNAQKVSEWVMVPREPTKEMRNAIAAADWQGSSDLNWDDGYRIMIAAAPTPDAHSEVGVKALEWIDNVAATPFGAYWSIAGFDGQVTLGAPKWSSGDWIKFPTLEEARLYAQTDFEARVRSCQITYLAEPVAITDEMVERAYAEFMADKGSGPDGRTTRQTLRDTLYAALASKPEGEL